MASNGSGRLGGRLALITGASRGIGAAVAKRYAAEGAHVILIARTVGGLEETDDAIKAAGGQATLVPVDLTQTDRLASLGPSLHERFGKLDIFVANAAMLGALSPVAYSDPKLWDKVMNLNFGVNYRLLQNLHPLLKLSDAGRALFVTDRVARGDMPFWGAYAVSKASLEKMALLYARDVAESTIRVALIDPGPTATKLRRAAYPGEPEGSQKQPDDVTDPFVTAAEPNFDQHGALLEAQPSLT